jgi:thiol-disulfide isomerase/thioredoxin
LTEKNIFDVTKIEENYLLNKVEGGTTKVPRGDTIGTLSLMTKKMKYSMYKELVNPSGFVNSDPFQLKDIVGKKVILLDVMTYSCINCQRTFPYANAWYEKYKDKGLEIVAIHTPEFAFEHKIENVRDAMTKFGIKFPVVLDNDYGTWNAYGNNYWPRKYLIDIDGFVTYDHIGEGGYDETELQIKNALKERAERLGNVDVKEVNAPVEAVVAPIDILLIVPAVAGLIVTEPVPVGLIAT